MRLILRGLGGLALAVALAAGALVLAGVAAGQPPMARLGRHWYVVDAASLNAVQAAVERHIWAPLWSHAIFPVLDQPGPAVAGVALVLGLVLLILTRRPGGGRRRRRLFNR